MTAHRQRVPLLAVQDLSVTFTTRTGPVHALDRISFHIDRGEAVALVGESGSGKSVTAYAVMGLLEAAGKVTGGQALFGGLDLLKAPQPVLSELRGREISMIFQNPRAALNPIRPIGRQIADIVLRHGAVPQDQAWPRAVEMLRRVKIADPERRARAYPFELSGGMCQRVLIAMALACAPALLIADEPTTGLDVTTQAAIMALIKDLGVARGMATLLITHDLGLAAATCQRILVMHAGHLVESAPTAALLAAPRHPYTAQLLAATPRPGARLADLAAIPGGLPDLRRPDLPPCRFFSRCERRAAVCDRPLEHQTVGERHQVACRQPL